MGTCLDEARYRGKRNSRTQAATEFQFVAAAISFLSQSAVEQSVPTFRCRRCVKACRLRALCFRNVRSGALPGKRVCSSSRLLSFPSSRSLQSRHTGIGQYRSGVVFGRFSSPIKRSGKRSGYSKRYSPQTRFTCGRCADCSQRFRDQFNCLRQKATPTKFQRLSPQTLLKAGEKHCQRTDTGNFTPHVNPFLVA